MGQLSNVKGLTATKKEIVSNLASSRMSQHEIVARIKIGQF